MNSRAVTLSLIMAVLAVFFVDSYVTSIEEKAKKDFGAEVLVVTAKRDIKEMGTLDETMFSLTTIPKRFLEPSAIFFEKKDNDSERERDLKALSGAVAIVPIKAKEQISYNKITEPNMRTGLSPQVTPGRRAVAIPVNEVSGVGKLVKPGDRIDVIAVIETGNTRDSKVVRTVLQDAVVLAVGRNVTNNVARLTEVDATTGKPRTRSLTQYDGFTSVTIEVEPLQAQMLALLISNQNNALTLSLRNNDDTDRVAMGGISLGDVLGADAALIQRRVPAQSR